MKRFLQTEISISYAHLFLGLLFLVVLAFLFSRPGGGSLEIFASNLASAPQIFINLRYPPGLLLLLKELITIFPLNLKVPTYDQNVFYVFKYLIMLFYFLTLAAIIYFVHSCKVKKISYLETITLFFSSVAILHLSLSLTFFDIFAAPLFILTITYLLKKKAIWALICYLLALSFNLILIFAAPLFVIYVYKNKIYTWKIIKFFYVIFSVAVVIFILQIISNFQVIIYLNDPVKVMNLMWFIERPLLYPNNIFNSVIEKNLLTVAVIFFSAVTLIGAITLLLKIFYVNTSFKVKIYMITFTFLSLLFIGIIWLKGNTFIAVLPLELFILILIRFYLKISSFKHFSANFFIYTLFCLYILVTLLFPFISLGNLLWLLLLSLLLLISEKNEMAFKRQVAVNLLVFVNTFLYLGLVGWVQIYGVFIDTFRFLFAAAFVAYCLYELETFVTINESEDIVNLGQWSSKGKDYA